MAAPIVTRMSGVMHSVVLVQTCFGAVYLDAMSVCDTFAVVCMSVIVVMACILNTVMGMRGFKGAIRHRVKSHAPQHSNCIVITGFVMTIDHTGITTRYDYEQNSKSD
jgi:hypothetical protein